MKNKDSDLYVVGIGASAGGLEALQLFVKQLAEKSDMAYIVAQHLSPTYKSMMVDLIARETHKKVFEIKNGMVIQKDTIYITPPNKDVFIKNGILELKIPQEAIGPRPSINLFFTSLAQSVGNKAIGIILSGTGTDGSYGIRAIKAEGGITIAQNPLSAKYDGMPNSAINTGNVDLILNPEDMGSELIEIVKYPKNISIINDTLETNGGMEKVYKELFATTGIDFSQYKTTTINRRLERRMSALKLMNLSDYVNFLSKNKDEINNLFKDILIGVTSFFRDRECFEDLKIQLGKMIENKKDKSIRIWIVGCSSGEEPYSIAILLSEILGIRISEYDIQIFATDVDVNALLTARKAIYPESLVEDLPKAILKKYFLAKQNGFELIKPIREMLIFSKHDIISDPPFLKTDLITCRNLLIYFNTELQKKIFSIFHYSLNDTGFLFLGKSESVGQTSELFEILEKRSKIFTPVYKGKKELYRNFNILKSKTFYAIPKKEISEKFNPEEMLIENLSNILISSSILLNDTLELIYKKGKNSYLQIPDGVITSNIYKLIHSELTLDLRTALHKINKEELPYIKTPFREIEIGNGGVNFVRIIISKTKRNERVFYILYFQEELNSYGFFKALAKEGINSREEQLEFELIKTKEQLQAVIEELETTNEEMQSLNEELQSSNEELQSSNEELETTNEELQSTNEELQTAYSELKVSYDEQKNQQIELKQVESLLNETGKIAKVGGWEFYLGDLKTKWTKEIYNIYEVDFNFKHIIENMLMFYLQKEEMEKALNNLIKNGESFDLTVPIISAKSNKKIVRITGNAEFQNNKPNKLYGIIQDLTEEFKIKEELENYKTFLEQKVTDEVNKNREKDKILIQQSKLAALGEMLGAIAHQWRQPLNTINLSSYLIEELNKKNQNQNTSIQKYINQIIETTEYLSNTIDDFRNFFKPNKDKDVFDVVEIVKSSISLISAQLTNHSIKVELNVKEGGNYRLNSYPNEFKQVLINIFNNAKDSIILKMQKENIEIGVITISICNNDNSIKIEINDNGVGIDKSIIDKIFEPYFSTKFSAQGTGIGLYMSKSIIENSMNGTLNAKSKKSGAVFIIKIPF